MTRSLGAAALAGLVCGGVSVGFATTILAVARPGAMTIPVALAVWGGAGLAAAAFCWRARPPRQIWGRVALTMGLHALALPVAAALAFGATAIWPPPETADLGLSLDVFGVRLVGTPTSAGSGSPGSSSGSSSSRSAIAPSGTAGVPARWRRATGRISR